MPTDKRINSQTWNAWSVETPPTPGAFLTNRGWEIQLAGSPTGQTELLVALARDYTITAAEANIVNILLPNPGFYVAGTDLEFIVCFNEKVTVNTGGGTPRLTLTVGGSSVFATYQSGTGTSQLTFKYTIQTNDIDLDGITIASNVGLNSGTITDTDTLSTTAVTFTNTSYNTAMANSVIVDALQRTLSSFTSSSGNVTTGNPVNITATFNNSVIVNTAGGVPTIALYKNDGTTLVGQAAYVSGSGSATLVFRYVVIVGDVVATAAKAGPNIVLNGGAIFDYKYPTPTPATLTRAQTTLTGVTIN
jgi:hypothetical protein